MNRLLKKRMLIISISLALLLLINLGVSYSYYLGKVVGNESKSTLSLKSTGIIIEYENNSGETSADDIMSGWSATKDFSVSSNIVQTNFNNGQSKLWYEILLYVDQNDFPSNIMTYSLESLNTSFGDGVPAETRNVRGIETGENGIGISLGVGNFAVGTNRHDYRITFNYVDNGSEYSNYPDKVFSVHIGAKVVVCSSININLDGGNIEGETTKYVGKGGTVLLPIPTKDEYIFTGWIITNGNGRIVGNNVTVNDEVLNISATWRSKTITSVVQLNLDGGTSSHDTLNDITIGEIQTLDNPTKDGYVFRGWELVDGEAEISGNKLVAFGETVSLVAIWEPVVPEFTYTGTYTLINDSANNWRIKFLTSGTLNFSRLGNADSGIDLFLVGGGGSGGKGTNSSTGGGGGGGGYTRTIRNISIQINQDYSLVVGGAGTETRAFNYKAAPGNKGNVHSGGSGGSGGGDFSAAPGTDGNDGADYSSKSGYIGGKGQRSTPGPNGETGTTREFGEATGDLYSTGGRGNNTESGAANTGNGGGGSNRGYGAGGSGIVIIRNKK